MEKKEAFFQLLTALRVPDRFDREFLYRAFSLAEEGTRSVSDLTPRLDAHSVNPLSLALYVINEHSFYLLTHPEKKEAELVGEDNYLSFIVSVALDKYYTNEHLAYQSGKLTSRFSPFMSTLDLYLNFILGMLSRYKKNDPNQTLIVDIMSKGFSIAKCVATLLEGGFETEAFSTWRTLHENECILAVLVKHGVKAIQGYLTHMRYAAAFRGAIESKEATDAVFVEIKSNMREAGLKSKDMKRFIEYGWLYSISGETPKEEVKLNFRDGVQAAAGLSQYSKVYEMSSEIAHSSPLLIYSRKNYVFHVALLNLYESFFRLEKIFSTIYMSSIQEEERKRYAQMRQLYFGELLSAYKQIQRSFASLGSPKEEQGEPTIKG